MGSVPRCGERRARASRVVQVLLDSSPCTAQRGRHSHTTRAAHARRAAAARDRVGGSSSRCARQHQGVRYYLFTSFDIQTNYFTNLILLYLIIIYICEGAHLNERGKHCASATSQTPRCYVHKTRTAHCHLNRLMMAQLKSALHTPPRSSLRCRTRRHAWCTMSW